MASNFIYRRFGIIVLIAFIVGTAAANSQQTKPVNFDDYGSKTAVFDIPCSELGTCQNKISIFIAGRP